MRASLALFAFAVILSFPVAAADSPEAAMQDLAKQLVDAGAVDKEATLAVTAFQHNDTRCSQLSNYMADLLSANLQGLGRGRIRLFERQLLPAIFDEIRFGLTGPVDPDTAPEAGRIGGVDSLVVGSITEFPDRISVVARLVRTSTGGVVAFATTTFPRTGSIDQMIAERSRAACGITAEAPAQDSAAASTTSHSPRDPVGTFSAEGFEARVERVVYNKSKKTANFIIRFTNTSEGKISLAYVAKSAAVSDGLGNIMPPKDVWTGLRICSINSFNCVLRNPDRVTTISAGKTAQLNFNVSAEGDEPPERMNVTMDLVYSPNEKAPKEYRIVSFGLYDLTPEIR